MNGEFEINSGGEMKTAQTILEAFDMEISCESDSSSNECGEIVNNFKRKKRKMKIVPIPYNKEKLTLKCEWSDCSNTFFKMEDFCKHIEFHLSQNFISLECFNCEWKECGWKTNDKIQFFKHVYYHGFHAKIKSIGETVIKQAGAPPCNMDARNCNIIPELPDAFMCFWIENDEICGKAFVNCQTFYWHMQAHVECCPRGYKLKEKLRCKWQGCLAQIQSMYKMRDHIRTHSQEKLAACPNCGGLFANKTKLYDHCKRQWLQLKDSYRCSFCHKYFSSSRLLRDHFRIHINCYRCPHCDKSAPSPSALNWHIRYRHLEDKPYSCSCCDFSCKTNYDLMRHMAVHSDAAFHCDVEKCTYTCRSSAAMANHSLQHEGKHVQQYACHLCSKRFNRGNTLTRHLIKIHKFVRTRGQSRFTYRIDEDGFYKLQIVRYESVDVADKDNFADKSALVLNLDTLYCRRNFRYGKSRKEKI